MVMDSYDFTDDALDELRWPRLGLSIDFRHLAGVEPALILDLVVPAEADALALERGFVLTADGRRTVTSPHRSEVWILGALPRTPAGIDRPISFASRSQNSDTLHKLYFSLPADGAWQFETPAMSSNSYELAPKAVSGTSTGGRASLSVSEDA
jgi:hypothetical protein